MAKKIKVVKKSKRSEYNCVNCSGEGLFNGLVCKICKGTGKI